MRCHLCPNEKVILNRAKDGIRWYNCPACGESFTTREELVVFNGTAYLPAPNRPKLELPEVPPSKRPRSPVVERMRECRIPADSWGLPPSMARDVKYWWEQSRWIKHGPRAVWTERALLTSVRRLVTLHSASPADAEALLEQAVEKGWQALDPKYLRMGWDNAPARPAPAAPAGPKDKSMQSALATWNESP
jgi:uncharacterized C2H2 Zn-finger protein